MNDKLLPCPFCGCTTIKREDDGHDEWLRCDWCNATGPYTAEDDEAGIGLDAAWNRRPSPPETHMPCERCQGNGEIVTDWERYKHPHKGDVGDEAVAECPDCNGTGEIFGHDDDCNDDLCALNGDMHSCAGKVEPCGCTSPQTRAVGQAHTFHIDPETKESVRDDIEGGSAIENRMVEDDKRGMALSLGRCVDALRKISGDPENDIPGEEMVPSVRIARECLANIGASMASPSSMTHDN